MPVTNEEEQSCPLVSILIAARNEEETILPCLRALQQLDYPLTFEVLVGNDQSTDRTAERVTQISQDDPRFRLINITQSVNALSGNPNVLAQLAQQARGDYFFFTDADTQIPTSWLTAMEKQFVGPVGVLTGVTLPQGPQFFDKLQAVDWLYNLTLTHWVSSLGVPVTAMGNNMAVSRRAYDAVGGYAALPFSVTEDYTLFRAIVQHGFGFRNLLDETVLAYTKPVDTIPAFLQQRKRWMRGATQLPRWMVWSLYGNYLAGPLLLLLTWFSPILAIGLYVSRLLIQTTLLSLGVSRLRQTTLWPYVLLFDLYQLLMGPVAVLYYWLPTTLIWKGRTYQ